MKKFMDDNFLLNNDVAIELYHNYAKKMPIYDYHCHLSAMEISENKRYKNLTELWLSGDHYKWRALRSNGIDESYITGNASDFDKFMAWAKTMPYCIGNPLYHWSHLELQRFFNIETLLSEQTAGEIWEQCNDVIQTEEFTARELIKKANVKVICTTDDPTDSLCHHMKIREDETFETKVFPTFRPDHALNIAKKGFNNWIEKLAKESELDIRSYSDLLDALKDRINHFLNHGCFMSDHSLESFVYEEASDAEIEAIFHKGLKNESLTKVEVNKYKTRTLLFLGSIYSELGWTMQLHIGAMRNNNTKMLNLLGTDSGFDSIGDSGFAYSLSQLLDRLDKEDKLPKTILYCLNPRDNEVLGSMLGNFQSGGIASKIQFGPAWWFNDHKDGMERHMIVLANLGLLSRFIGMVTDSRSFLSFTRHEYFRRILCNILGKWVENGEVPYDLNLLRNIVEGICYNNAQNYFGV